MKQELNRKLREEVLGFFYVVIIRIKGGMVWKKMNFQLSEDEYKIRSLPYAFTELGINRIEDVDYIEN